MAISNFISTVWSESLLTALDKKYIGVSNCNREYEGDIRNRGDRVKICGVGPVTVFNYTKNTDFASGAETLSDSEKTLLIDQAKAFNFQIDDVDRAQSNPKLMNEAMRTAASALAGAADAYVYSLYGDAGSTVENSAATASNILDTIIDARTKLLENNVNDPGDIVMRSLPPLRRSSSRASLLMSAMRSLTAAASAAWRAVAFMFQTTSSLPPTATKRTSTNASHAQSAPWRLPSSSARSMPTVPKSALPTPSRGFTSTVQRSFIPQRWCCST